MEKIITTILKQLIWATLTMVFCGIILFIFHIDKSPQANFITGWISCMAYFISGLYYKEKTETQNNI